VVKETCRTKTSKKQAAPSIAKLSAAVGQPSKPVAKTKPVVESSVPVAETKPVVIIQVAESSAVIVQPSEAVAVNPAAKTIVNQ
jgi:hypothetical protein